MKPHNIHAASEAFASTDANCRHEEVRTKITSETVCKSVKRSLVLIPIVAMLSSCAFYRELASPWKTYHGIYNAKKLPIDSIKARLKPFEVKHDLKIKQEYKDGIEYDKIIYFSGGSGGTPTTCRLIVYMSNDTVNVLANPCKQYPNSRDGWTEEKHAYNAGDQQVILDEIYYRYIDPANDSAKIILERDHADDILGDEGELKLVIASKKFFKN